MLFDDFLMEISWNFHKIPIKNDRLGHRFWKIHFLSARHFLLTCTTFLGTFGSRNCTFAANSIICYLFCFKKKAQINFFDANDSGKAHPCWNLTIMCPFQWDFVKIWGFLDFWCSKGIRNDRLEHRFWKKSLSEHRAVFSYSIMLFGFFWEPFSHFSREINNVLHFLL